MVAKNAAIGRPDLADAVITAMIGPGGIVVDEKKARESPCQCILIDPKGSNVSANRMCTSKGIIGTLSDTEEREYCKDVTLVSDGRADRARRIREAAKRCKGLHPGDTKAFFGCYILAFRGK